MKKALYQPVRDSQNALYFRQINGFYTPCAKTAPGAERMTMMLDFGDEGGVKEVPKGKLRVAPVAAKHFYDILAECKTDRHADPVLCTVLYCTVLHSTVLHSTVLIPSFLY